MFAKVGQSESFKSSHCKSIISTHDFQTFHMIPSGTYRYLHHSLYVKDGPALTIFGWQGMIRAQQLDIDCSTQTQVVVSPVSNIQSIKTVLHENKDTFFVGGSIKLLPDYCIRKAKGRLLLAGARDICISIYLSIKKRMLFTFSLSFFFFKQTHSLSPSFLFQVFYRSSQMASWGTALFLAPRGLP